MKVIQLIQCLIVLSCVSQKVNDQSGIDILAFGSGGGFTGAKVTYLLNSGGELSKIEQGNVTRVKKVDRKLVQTLFQEASTFKTYQYHIPDNVYSLLRIESKENKNEIVWGLGSTKVEPKVVELYRQLMALTK